MSKKITFRYCFYNYQCSKPRHHGRGGPCNCNNLTASALLQVSLLLPWLRLCQNQATCAQPEVLGRANKHNYEEVANKITLCEVSCWLEGSHRHKLQTLH